MEQEKRQNLLDPIHLIHSPRSNCENSKILPTNRTKKYIGASRNKENAENQQFVISYNFDKTQGIGQCTHNILIGWDNQTKIRRKKTKEKLSKTPFRNKPYDLFDKELDNSSHQLKKAIDCPKLDYNRTLYTPGINHEESHSNNKLNQGKKNQSLSNHIPQIQRKGNKSIEQIGKNAQFSKNYPHPDFSKKNKKESEMFDFQKSKIREKSSKLMGPLLKSDEKSDYKNGKIIKSPNKMFPRELQTIQNKRKIDKQILNSEDSVNFCSGEDGIQTLKLIKELEKMEHLDEMEKMNNEENNGEDRELKIEKPKFFYPKKQESKQKKQRQKRLNTRDNLEKNKKREKDSKPQTERNEEMSKANRNSLKKQNEIKKQNSQKEEKKNHKKQSSQSQTSKQKINKNLSNKKEQKNKPMDSKRESQNTSRHKNLDPHKMKSQFKEEKVSQKSERKSYRQNQRKSEENSLKIPQKNEKKNQQKQEKVSRQKSRRNSKNMQRMNQNSLKSPQKDIEKKGLKNTSKQIEERKNLSRRESQSSSRQNLKVPDSQQKKRENSPRKSDRKSEQKKQNKLKTTDQIEEKSQRQISNKSRKNSSDQVSQKSNRNSKRQIKQESKIKNNRNSEQNVKNNLKLPLKKDHDCDRLSSERSKRLNSVEKRNQSFRKSEQIKKQQEQKKKKIVDQKGNNKIKKEEKKSMILDDPELKKELALNSSNQKNQSFEDDDQIRQNKDDPSLLLKNMENNSSRDNIFTPPEELEERQTSRQKNQKSRFSEEKNEKRGKNNQDQKKRKQSEDSHNQKANMTCEANLYPIKQESFDLEDKVNQTDFFPLHPKMKKKIDDKNLKQFTENRKNYGRAPILSFIYLKNENFIEKQNLYKISETRCPFEQFTLESASILDPQNLLEKALQIILSLNPWLLNRIYETYVDVNGKNQLWLYCKGKWEPFSSSEPDSAIDLLKIAFEQAAEKFYEQNTQSLGIEEIIRMITGLRVMQLKNHKKLFKELNYNSKKGNTIKGISTTNKPTFEILGVQTTPKGEKVLQIKKDHPKKESSEVIWVKEGLFNNYFEYFILIGFRNESFWTQKQIKNIENHRTVYTIQTLNVVSGSVQIFCKEEVHCQIEFYKEMKPKMLKFVGKISQKTKQTRNVYNPNPKAYFDFNVKGRYYLFIDCPVNSRLALESSAKLSFNFLEYIKNQTYKNDTSEYVEVNKKANLSFSRSSNNISGQAIKERFIDYLVGKTSKQPL